VASRKKWHRLINIKIPKHLLASLGKNTSRCFQRHCFSVLPPLPAAVYLLGDGEGGEGGGGNIGVSWRPYTAVSFSM
jgi:hypothetical protein